MVTTSEGMSRWEIGRHRWADFIPFWSMSKDGFRQLYDSAGIGRRVAWQTPLHREAVRRALEEIK